MITLSYNFNKYGSKTSLPVKKVQSEFHQGGARPSPC